MSENERRAADVLQARDLLVRGGSALVLIVTVLITLLALQAV